MGIDEGNLALLVLDRAPAHPEGKTEIIQHVIAVVGQQFAAIRGIPAFYRMLNKPVPTKSSPYVNSALRPIMAFQTVAAQVAPVDTTTAWAQCISDGAAAEFGSQASQLLESTRRQEASVRRLAGRLTGNVGGDSQVSDLDKIYIQLCIDVDTFTASIVTLCDGAANFKGLKQLSEVTQPARASMQLV